MNSYDQSTAWLLNSPLAPYIDAYKQHFIQESYSPKTSKAYLHYVAHFASWMTQINLDIHHINETTIQEFINVHQSNCTNIYYAEKCMHAALIHLINILVEEGVSIYPDKKPTLVDEELQAFDDYMNHVKGLAPKTRHQYLYITERLLCEQFSTGAVVISEIMPEDVRQFINHHKELYTTSGNFSLLISALRGYFRYRTTSGDQVNHLTGVANYPANWQLSSLPRTVISGSLQHFGNSR